MKKSTTVIAEQPVSFRNYYYILGILVFFVFANTISNGYNLDDNLVTNGHPMTSRGLEAVYDIFTSPYYSDDMGYTYGYRPIVHLSFALEHTLFGEKPGVSHFLNVLLYAFSVVLFFRLLMKWTDQKGLLLAFLAAVLFAVHPVHTEVVASIKNRDEILAFFFVVLSGLSFDRYLDKKRMVSLFWILLFFTCAMLSKKSVYPMLVVLPVAFYFLKSSNPKDFILPVLCLLVPGVYFAAENELVRGMVLIAVPLTLFGIAYFLHPFIHSRESLTRKALLGDFRLHLVLSVLLFLWGMWEGNLFYFLLSFPFTLVVLYRKIQLGLGLLALQTTLFGFLVHDFELLRVALIFSVGSFFYFSRTKLNVYLLALSVLSVALFLVAYSFDLEVISSIFVIAVTAFLLVRKTLYGLLFAAVFLVVYALLYGINGLSYFTFLVPAIALVKLVSDRKPIKSMVSVLSVLVLFICFLLPSNRFRITLPGNASGKMILVQNENNQPALSQKAEKSNFLKEGRKLEMVENTLVMPHSKSETFATGANTLGEYLRLMVFPYELSFYYGYAKTDTAKLSNPWVWVSLLIHLFLGFLAVWQLKKRPLLSLGIVWYLACILLFSNWVELVAGMVGERLAFIASAGFCIFIAALILWIKPNLSFKKPGMLEAVVALVVLVFAIKTIVRNSDWKDPLTLMGHDIQHLENSAQANKLYAIHLGMSAVNDTVLTQEERDNLSLAIRHFDQALKIWPGFLNAAYEKGKTGISAHNIPAAIDGFERTVALDGQFLDAYYDLANAYLAADRKKDFFLTTKKIFRISQDTNAYSAVARGYFVNGDIDSARLVLREGIARFPENKGLKGNLMIVGE